MLPLLAEVMWFTNHKRVEERLRRRRARDVGLTAPAYCCDEESRLRVAQRFGNYWEHRDGLRRQEVIHSSARVIS